jgi:hypothetical protein
MIKTKKEEAMGYRGKDMRQMLLLVGVGLLALSLAGGICGCGSNDPQPVSRRQDKKSVASTSARVLEVLPKTNPGSAIPQARAFERTDLGSVPAFPPDKFGNPGPTLAEIQAKVASTPPLDPALIPAVPPDAEGNPGPTLAEIQAKVADAERNNQNSFPMVPPEDNIRQ